MGCANALWITIQSRCGKAPLLERFHACLSASAELVERSELDGIGWARFGAGRLQPTLETVIA
jgi:hypothetical protein